MLNMELQVKERPILFSGPMVKAILDGRKTQTRRAVKPQPSIEFEHDPPVYVPRLGIWCHPCAPHTDQIFDEPCCEWWRCPYGRVGDRLWVREAWAETDDEYGIPIVAYSAGGSRIIGRHEDGRDFLIAGEHGEYVVDRWRPSIHMPRWASRLLLEITDVRVQRVQEISGADAIAEGIPNVTEDDSRIHEAAKIAGGYDAGNHELTRLVFRDLWDSINAKRGHSWESNPWVWAVSFKRVEVSQ